MSEQPDPRVLRVEIGGRTVWQVIGAILLTIVLLRAAGAASGLLGLVGLSFFFSLALDPAVRGLTRRRGWRRGAAVGVIYAAGIVSLVLMVFVLIPAVEELARRISENGSAWVARLNAWTSETVGVPITTDGVAESTGQAGSALEGFADDVFGRLLGIASTGVSLVFNMATIAMFTFYFTADAPRIKRAVLRLFSARTQERIGWAWDEAITQTGGYFYSRILLMAVNGTGFFLTMLLVGLPLVFALPLAVFAGFVSVFIPAIGTYIGSAVPIAITLAIQGLVPALIVLAYALIYQQLENYWLSPRISANTMSLNGGVAFGAALAGGAIAGPVGAFVALPVAAMISASITTWTRSHEITYHSPYDEAEDPPAGEPAAPPAPRGHPSQA